MDESFTCSCQMKIDLKNSVDLFSFLEENYPIPGIVNNLNKLSYDDRRCACCLMHCFDNFIPKEKEIIGVGNGKALLTFRWRLA